jgi:hypothetical protein
MLAEALTLATLFSLLVEQQMLEVQMCTKYSAVLLVHLALKLAKMEIHHYLQKLELVAAAV